LLQDDQDPGPIPEGRAHAARIAAPRTKYFSHERARSAMRAVAPRPRLR
jgi:hypothetical protein